MLRKTRTLMEFPFFVVIIARTSLRQASSSSKHFTRSKTNCVFRPAFGMMGIKFHGRAVLQRLRRLSRPGPHRKVNCVLTDR